MPSESALLPTQTVRLAALGILAEGAKPYAELAREVVDFIRCILGQSLDLMGTSLELLRYEGLIEAKGGTGMIDNAEMRLTPTGEAALRRLLAAGLNAPGNELNHLVLALKLRFLPILGEDDRCRQLALIGEWYAGEILRLEQLRTRHAGRSPQFRRWIEREIELTRERLGEIADLARPPPATP
jgi:putative AphA-like transcriptional regulator